MLPDREYIVYVYPNGCRVQYKRVPTGRRYIMRYKMTTAFRYKVNVRFKR